MYPTKKVPYYNRDPKRDPNFDNHPNKILVEPQESPSKSLKGLGFPLPPALSQVTSCSA